MSAAKLFARHPSGVALTLDCEDAAAALVRREQMRAEGRLLERIGVAGPRHVGLTIFGEIDTAMADLVENRLCGAPFADRIDLAINSHGGSVFDAFDIFCAIGRHPAKTKVARLIRCSSAAVIVAMSADHRIAFPDTEIVLHPSSRDPVFRGRRWTAARYREEAAQLDWLDTEFAGLIAARCGAPLKAIEDESATEYPASLAWALQHGIIHEVHEVMP